MHRRELIDAQPATPPFHTQPHAHARAVAQVQEQDQHKIIIIMMVAYALASAIIILWMAYMPTLTGGEMSASTSVHEYRTSISVFIVVYAVPTELGRGEKSAEDARQQRNAKRCRCVRP